MGLTHSLCDKNVANLANKIIKKSKSMHRLSCLKILYVFRSTHDTDNSTGQPRVAVTRKLANKMRDVHGYDVEIAIAEDFWDLLNPEEKRRVLWHELQHISVEFHEDKPVCDKAGRIKIDLRHHDLVMNTFMTEIKTFGPTESQLSIFRELVRVVKAVDDGRIPMCRDFPLPMKD